MIDFAARGILLDVEGTTSSIAFVYEVLFPYARRELDAYLAAAWDAPALDAVREQFARDAGLGSFAEWAARRAGRSPRDLLRDEALALMDADRKATGLKQLQGLIWERGYRDGTLRSHVYPDVAPALRGWAERAEPLAVRIYSSGSVAAQKLFFAHTVAGDLTPWLRGHYDTTTGPKQSPASYRAIAGDMRRPPGELLFLSDVAAELDAAAAAGLRVALVVRPGNRPTPECVHPRITTLEELRLVSPAGSSRSAS